MKMFRKKTPFITLLLLLALFQTSALAAEGKPKYKKTTGNVVSASATSVVIKGKKQPVTMAVNAGTEIIGAKAVKAGDKAQVNYRSDKNGNTATRIKVLEQAAAKPGAAPAAYSSVQKTN